MACEEPPDEPVTGVVVVLLLPVLVLPVLEALPEEVLPEEPVEPVPEEVPVDPEPVVVDVVVLDVELCAAVSCQTTRPVVEATPRPSRPTAVVTMRALRRPRSRTSMGIPFTR